MAQRRIIELLDDLDGGTANETVDFGLDGHTYEIDLSTTNAKRLRTSLAKFEAAARRLPAKRAVLSGGQRASAAGGRQPSDAGIIREWAIANGYDVNRRGRIPAPLRAAYAAR